MEAGWPVRSATPRTVATSQGIGFTRTVRVGRVGWFEGDASWRSKGVRVSGLLRTFWVYHHRRFGHDSLRHGSLATDNTHPPLAFSFCDPKDSGGLA